MTAKPSSTKTAGGPKSPAAETPPRFAVVDFFVLLGLPVLLAVSWLTPPRAWHWFARSCAPLAAQAVAGKAAQYRERIARMCGTRIGGAAVHRAVYDAYACYIEEQLQLLRGYRPGGWNPTLTVVGREHIDAALEDGHGVVLWVSYFAYYSLIAKMALAREGYAVSHLSHPRHGFSGTRFGMAALNPVCNRVEDRFLEERVFLSLTGAGEAMRKLAEKLRRNGVVSIAARQRARRTATAPFLDGEMTLALGAPSLALSTGAALLPVHTLRLAPERFEVIVGPPVAADRDGPADAAMAEMARAYAADLEPHVLAHPGQWRGWHD